MKTSILTASFPQGAREKSKCNTVEMLHFPLSPGGRGPVVSVDWYILGSLSNNNNNNNNKKKLI